MIEKIIKYKHIIWDWNETLIYEVSKHIGSDCLLVANGHHSYEKLVRLGIGVIRTLKEIN